jgi:nucleoside-diphosphate-sugar epimerase
MKLLKPGIPTRWEVSASIDTVSGPGTANSNQRLDPYDGRVVISFIRQALNNEPVTVFGDGKQTRSLCYVSDLVRGINLTMESSFNEPINLGNPDEVTIVQIAREILQAIPGTTSQIVHLPQPEVYKDDPKVRCPDITRAKEVLGWTPQISRREGLARMIEHYRGSLRPS